MDYAKLSSRALSIITKYGTSITLSYFSPGTYSAITGSYSNSTYTDIATKAVFDIMAMSAGGGGGRQGMRAEDLKVILEDQVDCIAYIPSYGITTPPSIRDRIKRGGQIFEILGPEELKPAAISLMWTLFLRKG